MKNALQRINDLPIELARAVKAWLDYNASVCGEIGVQENMINQPIKAFSIFHQNEYSFEFEKRHPYLSTYCHVDFYMEMKKKSEGICYFEFKQAKPDTTEAGERQRIFNDIARLSSLVEEKCRCFFLVFGTGFSYKECFLNYSLNKKTALIRQHGTVENVDYFYHKWLSFNEEQREQQIEIKKDDLYNNFKNKYLGEKTQNPDKATPPSEIKTRLLWQSIGDMEQNGVGIWEIIK